MKINLILPTSWNSCTTEQLEIICLAKQQVQMLPADEQTIAWKINCFLALAGMEVEEKPVTPDEEPSYVLVHSPNIPAHFKLYVWQIHYWVKEYLNWLDNNPNIIRFPYPEWRAKDNAFRGPSIRLSGWTWQQYRLLKDYLTYFFKIDEACNQNPNSDNLSKIQTAMAMVLATIYDAKVDYLDETTQLPTHGYHYHPDQSTNNRDYFLTFPPIKFAVILLWWGSVASQLKKEYPKCFGEAKETKKFKHPAIQDPLTEYARTTATLEKYMGVNEQELQHESYTVVLQHLQDMIKQNEEIERMNAKIKKK